MHSLKPRVPDSGGSNVARPLCFLLIGAPTRKLSIQELFGGLCAPTPEQSVATRPSHAPRTLSPLEDWRSALSCKHALEYLVTSLPALRLCGSCASTTAVEILGHCIFSAERFLYTSGSTSGSISSLRYRSSISIGRRSGNSPTVVTRLRLVVPYEGMIFGPRFARVGVGSASTQPLRREQVRLAFPFRFERGRGGAPLTPPRRMSRGGESRREVQRSVAFPQPNG